MQGKQPRCSTSCIRPLVTAGLLVACSATTGCDRAASAALPNRQVPAGDAARGRAIIERGAYGCAGCHVIPGVRAARGIVGPPLAGMSRRSFIAGQLPNKPDVLVSFLQNPPALVPGTGMPDARLSLDEARDIAAYLYTMEPSRAR